MATRDSGTGLPSNPNDPYLFAGLKPGTYYIGVSGAGNVPCTPGDTTLCSESQDYTASHSPAEFLRARPLRRPHDQPTRLLNVHGGLFGPDKASPTGLTLTFSGPIDLSKLFVPDFKSQRSRSWTQRGRSGPSRPRAMRSAVPHSESFSTDLSSRQLYPDFLARSWANRPGRAVGLPANGTLDVPWRAGMSCRRPCLRSANNLGVLWPLSSNQTRSTRTGPFKEMSRYSPPVNRMDFQLQYDRTWLSQVRDPDRSRRYSCSITEGNSTTILYATH